MIASENGASVRQVAGGVALGLVRLAALILAWFVSLPRLMRSSISSRALAMAPSSLPSTVNLRRGAGNSGTGEVTGGAMAGPLVHDRLPRVHRTAETVR